MYTAIVTCNDSKRYVKCVEGDLNNGDIVIISDDGTNSICVFDDYTFNLTMDHDCIKGNIIYVIPDEEISAVIPYVQDRKAKKEAERETASSKFISKILGKYKPTQILELICGADVLTVPEEEEIREILNS